MSPPNTIGIRWDWVGLWVGLLLTLLVGVVATLILRGAHNEEALRQAARIEDRLTLELTLMERSLEAIRTHLKLTPDITPSGFFDFHRAVLGKQFGGARAVAFVANIPDGNVEAMDQLLARYSAEYRELAYPDFDLYPVYREGPLMPAVLVEPAAARAGVFGFNLGSSPVRLEAVRRAIRTGELTMTEPIQLSQDTESRSSVLVVAPVASQPGANREYQGFVAVGITPPMLLEQITPPLEDADLSISLRYEKENKWQQWDESLSLAGMVGLPLTLTTTERVIGPIPFASSGFVVDYEARHRLAATDVVLILGPVLLSLLLTLIIFSYFRRLSTEAEIVSAELAAKEEALRDAERQAAQAQRMESIGQLTGGVAHDFNNLLSVVMANADLIMDDRSIDRELRDLANEIARAAKRGGDLTQRLLAFGRQSHLEPEHLDLRDVLNGMDQMLNRVLPETIELETVTTAGLWSVKLDRSQLENAILNLAINARDAMDGRGKLTIEASNMRLTESYIESDLEKSMEAGRFVMVSVSDTGCGMAEAEIQKAFEPFYTTKEVGEGSGLGLSMVYGFARQSGGTCHIYSEVGVGTTVKIYFPTSKGSDAEPIDESVEDKTPVTWSARRVLLVEDDEGVRKVLEKQLVRHGLTVVVAGNGEAGFEKLQSGERFDLLLSDIVMPGELQGPGLVRAALEQDPDLKVLLMSGYPQEALIHGNGVATQFRVLQKPISRESLLDALERELG